MRRSSLLRAALLTAALGGSAAVHAEGAAGRLIERMHRAGPAGAALQDAAAVADTTPPTLTQFAAGTTWSMNRGAVPLSVLVKGSDDLSGLSHILIQAVGPSGQGLAAYASFDYPVKSVSRRVSMSTPFFAGRLLEPGAWTIVKARFVDQAGNPRKVEGSALAALGNTAFTVVNTGTFDNVAPTLTSAQLLTSAVSLSGTAKGTTKAPFVGLKLGVADSGATGTAGIASVHAAFCLADESRCLDMLQSAPLGGNAPSATITIGQQVSPALGHVPGEYLLYELNLIDHAGNIRNLLSTAFGGTTDFGALMGNTKITLTP
jgi:hypothetical protein